MSGRNSLEKVISSFDSLFSGESKQTTAYGRLIHSNAQDELFQSYNPDNERLATLREIAQIRILPFDIFGITGISAAKELKRLADKNKLTKDKVKDTASNYPRDIAFFPQAYTEWRFRLTSSTSMTRSTGKDGKEYVFFYNGNPFGTIAELTNSLDGELSDGGIKFSSNTLKRILNGAYSRISYSDYLTARGGNFNGMDWLKHPVFSAAFNDSDLIAGYVLAMHMFGGGDFYHKGLHSGWLPREMKEGYGRFISLGYKGEAFYPVNSSTIGHSALVVPKDFKFIQQRL